MTDTAKIDEVLMFWFGPLNAQGLSEPKQRTLWFKKQDSTDQTCTDLFGELLEKAMAGELENWEQSDAGLIALIILLDQLTRNIYRNTAKSFSGDSQALALAQRTIASGRHLRLPLIHRVFLYLPLEHTEDMAVQEQCVALFEQLVAETGLELIKDMHRYSLSHRKVIAQFGRFPHRNTILGRISSPAEVNHLQTHGGF